jgi:hypothetical protein
MDTLVEDDAGKPFRYSRLPQCGDVVEVSGGRRGVVYNRTVTFYNKLPPLDDYHVELLVDFGATEGSVMKEGQRRAEPREWTQDELNERVPGRLQIKEWSPEGGL